jgi:hypothetical protein
MRRRFGNFGIGRAEGEAWEAYEACEADEADEAL